MMIFERQFTCFFLKTPVPTGVKRQWLAIRLVTAWWARFTPLKNISSSIGMIIPNPIFMGKYKKWQPVTTRLSCYFFCHPKDCPSHLQFCGFYPYLDVLIAFIPMLHCHFWLTHDKYHNQIESDYFESCGMVIHFGLPRAYNLFLFSCHPGPNSTGFRLTCSFRIGQKIRQILPGRPGLESESGNSDGKNGLKKPSLQYVKNRWPKKPKKHLRQTLQKMPHLDQRSTCTNARHLLPGPDSLRVQYGSVFDVFVFRISHNSCTSRVRGTKWKKQPMKQFGSMSIVQSLRTRRRTLDQFWMAKKSGNPIQFQSLVYTIVCQWLTVVPDFDPSLHLWPLTFQVAGSWQESRARHVLGRVCCGTRRSYLGKFLPSKSLRSSWAFSRGIIG